MRDLSKENRPIRVICSVAVIVVAFITTSCLHGVISYRCTIDDKITVVFDDVSYESAMLYIHDIAESNTLPEDEPHEVICAEVHYE